MCANSFSRACAPPASPIFKFNSFANLFLVAKLRDENTGLKHKIDRVIVKIRGEGSKVQHPRTQQKHEGT